MIHYAIYLFYILQISLSIYSIILLAELHHLHPVCVAIITLLLGTYLEF
jgi:uncharacterized membrane protein